MKNKYCQYRFTTRERESCWFNWGSEKFLKFSNSWVTCVVTLNYVVCCSYESETRVYRESETWTGFSFLFFYVMPVAVYATWSVFDCSNLSDYKHVFHDNKSQFVVLIWVCIYLCIITDKLINYCLFLKLQQQFWLNPGGLTTLDQLQLHWLLIRVRTNFMLILRTNPE